MKSHPFDVPDDGLGPFPTIDDHRYGLGPSINAEMTITQVAIDALTPALYNPRKISARSMRLLTEEIKAYGLVEPLVCNKRGGSLIVISGHQRLKVARALGWQTVPVHIQVDETRERALNLALNNPALQGEYDDPLVAALLRSMPSEDAGLAGFGAEYAGLLSADTEAEEPDQYAVPKEPVTKVGDMVTLGPHRLICGDATDPAVVARLLDGGRCDAMVCDPPYAIYGSSSGLSASITDDKIVRPFFRSVIGVAQASVKMFGHVYICCDWRSWPSWWEVARGTRIEPKNLLVWDKNGSGLGSNWANTYELIGYFAHMPEQKVMTGGRKAGQRSVLKSNIIRAKRPVGSARQHNAAKPVDLLETVIGAATDAGETVLDPFGGSGSTLIAAHRLGRRALLVEIDPGYCDVIRGRWAQEAKG
jgi:hypothetical protein